MLLMRLARYIGTFARGYAAGSDGSWDETSELVKKQMTKLNSRIRVTFVTLQVINYIFSVGVVTIAVNSANEMYTGTYVPPAFDKFL